LQIIKDIDVLLASDDNFLLGTWLESAKKLAVDPNDMKLVRTNSSLPSENNSIVII
jgi:alpha-N-acetylglucosaminidase